MVVLTEAQREELATSEAAQLIDPRTGKTYVLVQTEVYNKLRRLLEIDIQVTGEAVDRLMEEEDRDDPTLAYYQQRFGRKP